LDNVRLAMVFFLSAETMLFGAFVSGFFVLRLAAPQWPPPLQPRLPVFVTGLNTFVLMTSSAALLVAMAAFRRRDRARLVRGLALTAALGGLFLAALRLASHGRFLDGRAGVLRACAIYWHFVVALWPVLYVAVYLA